MEEAYLRDADFLKSLMCDLGKIDAEICPILAKKMNFPLVEVAMKIIEGILNLSLRATYYHELGIVFKISIDSEIWSLLETLVDL